MASGNRKTFVHLKLGKVGKVTQAGLIEEIDGDRKLD